MQSYIVYMQKILVDFGNVEMLFHAKALEMYTSCYRSLTAMNEEEDLEVSGVRCDLCHYLLARVDSAGNSVHSNLGHTENTYFSCYITSIISHALVKRKLCA